MNILGDCARAEGGERLRRGVEIGSGGHSQPQTRATLVKLLSTASSQLTTPNLTPGLALNQARLFGSRRFSWSSYERLSRLVQFCAKRDYQAEVRLAEMGTADWERVSTNPAEEAFHDDHDHHIAHDRNQFPPSWAKGSSRSGEGYGLRWYQSGWARWVAIAAGAVVLISLGAASNSPAVTRSKAIVRPYTGTYSTWSTVNTTERTVVLYGQSHSLRTLWSGDGHLVRDCRHQRRS